jgi:hypothetical protein
LRRREGRSGTTRRDRTAWASWTWWSRRPSGTIIRFVEGECRQPCAFACEENERILNTYAINPGGTFSFDADNKATFWAEQTAAALDVFPRLPMVASRLPGSAGA